MSAFLSLSEAASILGYKSGSALRKCFERQLIPARFLIRIGERTLRVDIAGLEAWLREQPAYPPAHTVREAGHGE